MIELIQNEWVQTIAMLSVASVVFNALWNEFGELRKVLRELDESDD